MSLWETEVLSDSPIARWKFNDATVQSVYTDSIGAHNLVAHSTTNMQVSTSPILGEVNSLTQHFPSWLDSTYKPTLGSYTVEFWLRPEAIGSSSNSCGLGAGGGSGFFFRVNVDGSITVGNDVPNGYYFDTVGNLVADGNWYHIVYTLNASTTEAKLYINGTLEQSATNQYGSVSNPYTWAFGLGTNTTVTDSTIKELLIYNTVLTPSRIATHYTAAGYGTPPPADSGYDETVKGHDPILYYRENDKNTIVKNAVSGPDGTSFNVIKEQGALISATSDPCFGFDGLTSYCELPVDPVKNLSTLSIECWFVWNGYPRTDQRIWDLNNNVAPNYNTGKYLFLTPAIHFNNRCRFCISNGGLNAEQYVDSTYELTPGTIYHAVCIYTSGQLKLYLNGVLQGTKNVSIAPNQLGLSKFYIGKSPWNWQPPGEQYDFFKGRNDEFAVYNYDISPYVKQHFDAGTVLPRSSKERAVVDYLSIDQSITNHIVANRGITDSITFSDYRGPGKQFMFDSLFFYDIPRFKGTYHPPLSEQFFLLDKVEYQSGKQFQLVDLFLIKDSFQGITSKSVKDVIEFIETLDTPGLKIVPVKTDILFLDSVVVRQPGKYKFDISDFVPFTDDVSTGNIYQMHVADYLPMFDSDTGDTPHKYVIEQITFFDTVTFKQFPTRISVKDSINPQGSKLHVSPLKANVLDTLNLIDSVRNNQQKMKVTDNITFNTGARNNQQKVSVVDSVTFSDAPKSQNNHQYVSDQFTILETIGYRQAVAQMKLVENVVFSDTPVLRWSKANITIRENITFIETLHRIRSQTYTDTITFMQDMHRVRENSVIHTLILTDSWAGQASKPITDVIAFRELVCLYMGWATRNVVDNITFTDFVSFRINGINDPRNPTTPAPGGTGFTIHATYKRSVTSLLTFSESIDHYPDPVDCRGAVLVQSAKILGSEAGHTIIMLTFNQPVNYHGSPDLQEFETNGDVPDETIAIGLRQFKLLVPNSVSFTHNVGDVWLWSATPHIDNIDATQVGHLT